MYPSKRQIPEKLLRLLSEIVNKYHPEWAGCIVPPGFVDLDKSQAYELRLSTTSEFCATGLSADEQPNSRGLLLEELIDWLGRL